MILGKAKQRNATQRNATQRVTFRLYISNKKEYLFMESFRIHK